MTLNYLERPKRTLSQKRCVFLSQLHKIWMKIDPYYQRQKSRPIILVSGDITFMGIFVGVPLGGGVKWEWGWRRRQFLAIWVATSSESSEIRPAVLYGDMLPLVDRQMIVKWMTLNDPERLFHYKMRFRPALLEPERLNVRNSTTSAILRCSVHCTIS